MGEDTVQQEPEAPVQFNLFDNVEVQEQRLQEEEAKLKRERKIQEAMLDIKKKFGKNAILNGGSYLEGATAKERNKQIGGHNSKAFKILTAVANISQGVALKCLNNAYQSAYQQMDAESYIRDEFQRLLAELLPFGIAACKKCANMEETDDIVEYYDAIKDELAREIEAIERAIARKQTSTRYIFKRAVAYGKTIGDKTLKDFLQHIWETTANTSIANESIKEYIFETVKSILLQGGAFWKNDIIDAMILGGMASNDYLITCDKKMQEHMEKYQKDHIEYANSLTLIQTLQQ